MLPSENSCYLGRKTAEDHVLCIHHVPAVLDGFALCHIGFHGDSSIIFISIEFRCVLEHRLPGLWRLNPNGTPISLTNAHNSVKPENEETADFCASLADEPML
jgi:hypothetical protein